MHTKDILLHRAVLADESALVKTCLQWPSTVITATCLWQLLNPGTNIRLIRGFPTLLPMPIHGSNEDIRTFHIVWPL
eukprot:1078343-Amphidinium_carterae.1